MGRHRGRPRRGATLTTIARVVPAVPSFPVDDGFAYRVPEAVGRVAVGSIVRVPLGGRRVRGYVTSLRTVDRPPERPLKDLIGVSGDLPVFDARLLETLRWAAIHYVAPVSVMLAKTAPPNLPRMRAAVTGPVAGPSSPAPDFTEAVASGRRPTPLYLEGTGPWGEAIAGLAAPLLEAGSGVMVVAPTVAEADALAADLERWFGKRVVRASSSMPAAAVTTAWARCQVSEGIVLVGTREVATWRVRELGLVALVEESRRAMKAPQSPTLHVRDVIRRRAAVERLSVAAMGQVPSVELYAAGVDVRRRGGRAWSVVEVVDRSEEPPGRGVVMEATRRAIAGALKRQASVFVFVSRRGYAPAFRCVKCMTLRRCPVCGSGPDKGDTCRRCGASLGPCVECGGARFEPLGAAVGRVVDELRRGFGDAVGPADARTPVQVGTERDLVGAGGVSLAVAIDADSLLLAPHYRASEDALRILARVAALVERGRGNRTVIQTGMPDHPVLAALRHGSPDEFLGELLAERQTAGFPPAGELMAVELDSPPSDADERLHEAAGEAATVFGPAEVRGRLRWLLQGGDLHPVRVRLRSLVQEWRDAGATVRVDADPIDL